MATSSPTPKQKVTTDDGKFELHKYGDKYTRNDVRHIIKLFEIINNNSSEIGIETTLDSRCEELQNIRKFAYFHERAKEIWKKDYKINIIKFINKLQKELTFTPPHIKEEEEDPLRDEINKALENTLTLLSPTSEELYKKFQTYLHIDDRDFFEVSLAVILDRKVKGDPLWFYLVAPPGGTKTELLRSCKYLPDVFTLDTLTSKSLISGLTVPDEKGEMQPIMGLLEYLDGKILIIKDFTTILQTNENERNEIYGQLRACYDGYYEKAFGTVAGKISKKASFGLLAAVTPIIDLHTKAHTTLGERFLKIRHEPDREKATNMALENDDPEIMRRELAKATTMFFHNLKTNNVPQIDKARKDKISWYAQYLSYMRAYVMCTYNNGRITSIEYSQAEVPTRIAKQLKKLAQCLSIIRGKESVTNEELKTLWRVVKDTSDQRRQEVVLELYPLKQPVMPLTISEFSKLQFNSVRNELEKMETLEIVVRKRVEMGKKFEDIWWFTTKFYNILKEILV